MHVFVGPCGALRVCLFAIGVTNRRTQVPTAGWAPPEARKLVLEALTQEKGHRLDCSAMLKKTMFNSSSATVFSKAVAHGVKGVHQKLDVMHADVLELKDMTAAIRDKTTVRVARMLGLTQHRR